jgi:hypothetical protein
MEWGVHEEFCDAFTGYGGDELVSERFDEVVANSGRPVGGRPDPRRVGPYRVEMLAGPAVEIATHGHQVEEVLGCPELGQVGGVGVGDVIAAEHLAA